MNALIESICEDNKVRYTKVGNIHFSAQKKDGYILFRELRIEPFKRGNTRPFRSLALNEVGYRMFSSAEDFFNHIKLILLAEADWVISDEENIELESFINLLTTIL